MSQSFDIFKQHLQEWMESHSGEYDAFEAGMNRRDDAGYQMVLAVAMGLAPEYEKIVSQRINRGSDGDISEIERLFYENGLAETLTGDRFMGRELFTALAHKRRSKNLNKNIKKRLRKPLKTKPEIMPAKSSFCTFFYPKI